MYFDPHPAGTVYYQFWGYQDEWPDLILVVKANDFHFQQGKG